MRLCVLRIVQHMIVSTYQQREMNMFQAIQTKYLGPTNIRGSRVKATADRGSIILSWEDSLNSTQNHVRAAKEYATRAGWDGHWAGGGIGSGYVFVLTDVNSSDGFVVAKKQAA